MVFVPDGKVEQNTEDSDIEIDPLSSLETKTWDPPQKTKEAISKYLKKSLTKLHRQQLQDKFPIPNVPAAVVPVLDLSVQHLLSQRKINIRSVPGALAMEAVQSRMLDAVGPLSAIHAAAVMAQEQGDMMHPDSVLEAINYALVHIGNANSQATFQRQRSVMAKINPSAVSLLSKEKLEAGDTDLFGTALRKTIKEAGEARKDFGMSLSYQKPASFRPFRSVGQYGRSPF